jgi:hypothetical protein
MVQSKIVKTTYVACPESNDTKFLNMYNFLSYKSDTVNKLHLHSLLFVPCMTWLGIIDQHYALMITPLFITPASTCFGTYMPSSGSVLYSYELLERQKWLCCRHLQYITIIIIFINCKWVDTRWQWSIYILPMHGLWSLITLDLVWEGYMGSM